MTICGVGDKCAHTSQMYKIQDTRIFIRCRNKADIWVQLQNIK